jgi:hypothetical protein
MLSVPTFALIDVFNHEMKCSRTLGLSRYGFELFDTPIKAGRFGGIKPSAKAHRRKGIIVSGPEQRRRSPGLVVNRRLTVAGRLGSGVNFTRYA